MKKILKFAKNSRKCNQNGFTLIELISVLIIMGVVVSVVIKKFELLSDKGSIIALQTAVRDLKSRESVAWFKIKLSDDGYIDDVAVYNSVDKSMGQGYHWNPGPDKSGGRLHFESESVELTRTPSTPKLPGDWN